MEHINWGIIDALGSAVGAAASIVIAAFGLLITLMLRRSDLRHQSLDRFHEYRRDLLAYTNETIDVMSEAHELLFFQPRKPIDNDIDRSAYNDKLDEYFLKRSRLLSQLSSLIDRGRFFFPNQELGGLGPDKEEANRGMRDRVLNRVLAAYYCVKAMDYVDLNNNRIGFSLVDLYKLHKRQAISSSRDRYIIKAVRHLSEDDQSRLLTLDARKRTITISDIMVVCKRSFVNELFSILQPARWLSKVERSFGIVLRSRKPEPTVLIDVPHQREYKHDSTTSGEK